MNQPEYRKSLINPIHLDALSGAVCAIEGIRDAVAVINGASGCKYGISVLVDVQDPDGLELPAGSSLRLGGQGRVPCTELTQDEIIFGTNDKLQRTLRMMIDEYQPSLIGVINTCIVMAIGDDTAGAIRHLSSSLNRNYDEEIELNADCKILPIESGRITGDVTEGFQRASLLLVDNLMSPEIEPIENSVNLIGPCISQYNWSNDLEEFRRLLGLIGVRIISTLTAGSYLQQIEHAPQAVLNIVTHDDYGTPIAQYLKEKFGMPFIGPDALPPYGLRETTSWLQLVAAQLGLPLSEAKGLDVEKIVRRETEAVERRLIPQLKRLTLRHHLKGVPFAIFAEAPACLSIASFLEEYLGLEPVLLGLKTVGQNTNPRPKGRGYLDKVLAQSNYTPKVLLKPDGFETQEALKATEPQLLLGSSLEQFLAYDAGVSSAFVGISYPVADEIMLTERPFVGYKGVLTITEKVINAV